MLTSQTAFKRCTVKIPFYTPITPSTVNQNKHSLIYEQPRNMETLEFGTFNVRGCCKDVKQKTLEEDLVCYGCHFFGIQETHLADVETTIQVGHAAIFSANDGKNWHGGVGFIVKNNLNPVFERISDRIAKCTIKLKDRNIVAISAYAPTLEMSTQNPELRDNFYNQLISTIDSVPKRHYLIVLGDFNAITGSGYKDFKLNMGRFGKGTINDNGYALLESCLAQNLFIANTIFRVKMCHRTTWQAPMRHYTTAKGETRKNPIRNQIDYVLIRNENKELITNARSYGGTKTESDHKLVKASMAIGKWNIIQSKKNKPKQEKLNVQKLCEPESRHRYYDKLKEAATSLLSNWNNITQKCKEIAKEVVGVKPKTKKSSNPEIKEKSEKRWELFQNISCLNYSDHETKIKEIKNERRVLQKDIKKLMKAEAEKEAKADHEHLDSLKDDSTKYFQVLRSLKLKTPKQPLFVKTKDGKIPTTNEEKGEVIKTYFKEALGPSNMEDQIKEYLPAPLQPPISKNEVSKATRSMKNGKSCGEDGIYVEMIKYAPPEIHEKIAEVLNTLHLPGATPDEIITGLLSALPKPGKPKGPPENLRPIILLSILRKILTIVLLRRTWPKLSDHIPIDQAAYQGGRSTTEQVFSIKVLCEKAIAAQDIKLDLKLIDMSKAFDTINRKILFEHLDDILDEGELYYISVLTNKPMLKIKVEDTLTSPFKTTQGIMQGDCLSAILFIFYLGKALSTQAIKVEADQKGTFYIEPKFADDITSATINDKDNSLMKTIDQKYPDDLKKNHLKVNESKTENHHVPPRKLSKPRDKNTPMWSDLDWTIPETYIEKASWKTCKLLGSRLDTTEDIKARKGQACGTMNKMSDIFNSKHLSLKTKMIQFRTYIQSTFMYNSELWALTETENKRIDSFHRKLLRKAINKQWPKKQCTTEQLYEITKQTPWSQTIKKRRLNWTGHLLRLPRETPARLALEKFVEPHLNKVGSPKTTWLSTVKRDLKDMENIPKDNKEFIDHLSVLASDRKGWSGIIIKECGMVRKD